MTAMEEKCKYFLSCFHLPGKSILKNRPLPCVLLLDFLQPITIRAHKQCNRDDSMRSELYRKNEQTVAAQTSVQRTKVIENTP